MRILVTGFNGYLASNLILDLNVHEILRYEYDVRDLHMYSDIDMILHFASPSDSIEFKDAYKTLTTIIDGTLNMIKIARANKCKIVYASTAGVIQPDNIYCHCKLLMEKYIKSDYNNYIILRIPRVYSKCRKKGLMRQIRSNTIPEEDMNSIVEYITLQDFINQTKPVLSETNITHEYTITSSNSIQDIKRWVEE